MLLRVIYERCIGLCHEDENYRDFIYFACTYTSRYFPIYDDDDEHASHDTQGSADLRTSLRAASSTMMGPGGCELPGDPHMHVLVVCREVLHIQFLSRSEATPMMIFK